MRNLMKNLVFAGALLFAVFFATPCLSDIVNAETKREAAAYQDADASSPELTHFAQGVKMQVEMPGKNGFVKTHLEHSIKGHAEAWISKKNLMRAKSSNKNSSAAESLPRETTADAAFKRFLAAAIFQGTFVAPSAFQTALGKATSHFMSPGLALEFGMTLGPDTSRWSVLGEFQWETASRDQVTSIGGTYHYSTITMVALGGFRALGGADTSLYVLMGLGFSETNSSHSALSQNVSGSHLGSLPFYFGIRGKQLIIAGLVGLLDLGYRTQKVSQVPCLNADATAQGEADFSLSGIQMHAGLGYQF